MLKFRAPVKIGETVEVTVAVAELFPERRRAQLSCICRAGSDIVRDGKTPVKVPSQPAKGRPLSKLWGHR
jgi:3-hydroxybutyryl-CoA dehydratase